MNKITDKLRDAFSLNAPNMLLLQRTLIDAKVSEADIASITDEVQSRCKNQKFDQEMISDILKTHDLPEHLAETVMQEERAHGMTYGMIACP